MTRDGNGRLAALLATVGLAGAGLAAALAPAAQAETRAWRFQAEGVMGSTLQVVAVGDPSSARAAADAALAEIARLDKVLSGWRADSELSALNRADRLAVSAELFETIAACERWRAVSGGAFDARRGLDFERLRTGAEADVAPLPSPTLDAATRTVVRPQAVRFEPDGLAKGQVIDAALAAARTAAPALRGMLVEVGGDLRCWGEGPAGAGWIAGIAAPGETADNAAPAVLVRAGGRALAVSGAESQGAILGDAGHLQAAVLAPAAADADALATALSAMPVDAGLAMVEALPGAEARVVEASGAVRATSGWESLTAAPAQAPVLQRVAAAAAGWPARFALTIQYELPNQGSRAYAPYVAVWITDEEGRLVRALTMLGDDLDYVGENYIWWRRYGRARPQVVSAIARPTRPPGRHTVVWDGKDDMGGAVAQGRYTVHIEAVRENGGHSYQTIGLTLGAQPAQGAAAADEELGPAAVRYGPRG